MSERREISWPGWEVTGLIGHGSYGSVYQIERETAGITEKAALKVLSVPKNVEEIEELRLTSTISAITTHYEKHSDDLLKEYSTSIRLKDNPNVVRCEDVKKYKHDDSIGWDIYIKLELLTPLKRAVPEKYDEQQAICLGHDLCNALVECEREGIIHRDIKPENIFVSKAGVYKLGDFGVAKVADKTMSGTLMGTYDYMAPEVVNRKEYGHRVDTYSVGLILYWWMNKNCLPFLPLPPTIPTADQKEDARSRRFNGEKLPEPINGSAKLKAIVSKACAYDPKDRYESAQSMLDDLNELVDVRYKRPVPPLPPKPRPMNPEITNPFSGGSGTVGPDDVRKTMEERKGRDRLEKRNRIKKILLGTTGIALIILLILLLLRMCSGNAQQGIDEITPTENTTETGTEVSETVESRLPEQLEWSEWMDELPDYVDGAAYDVEEQTLYRSRELETTFSTTSNKMDGWELVKTVAGTGEFGLWSDWSAAEATATDDREVETQTRYRYRTKETTTSSSSTKIGWTLYDTTYAWGEYGDWSKWSSSVVTSSDSRKVETKTQYSYRDKEFTTSSSSSLDGWILYDTTYGEWGNAQTTTTKPAESDTLKITATTQTGWGYYHYCNQYDDGSWGVDSIACGIQSHWHGYTSGVPLQATYISDHGGNQAYLGNACGYNFYAWFRNAGADTYSYTYETRTVTYHFYRYPDKWSSWSDTPVTKNSDREVKTQTLYRYKDRTQVPTYHFWKWGDWSDWSTGYISETEKRDVETRNFYRYRDKVEETTYYFRRWTEWTDYLPEEVRPSDTVEVETITQYRYKKKSE